MPPSQESFASHFLESLLPQYGDLHRFHFRKTLAYLSFQAREVLLQVGLIQGLVFQA